MLKSIWFYIAVGINGSLFAQTDSLLHRIVLIGDAGKLVEGKIPAIERYRSLHLSGDNTSIIYLGDNIYPKGLPDATSNHFEESRKILEAQVEPARNSDVSVYFTPGNHDWEEGNAGGWNRIKNQQRYIDSLKLPNVHFYPRDGCPGPEEIVVNNKLVIVFMDSQWWLHQNQKPGIDSDCECKTENEVIVRLKEIFSSHPGKMILLAMHHPLYTYGSHGGYFTLRQHFFPLTDLNDNLYIPIPVIGSIYPVVRGWFGINQDTKHPVYKKLIEKTEEVLKTYPYAVHAAGHEHALQFLIHDSIPFIVSGSAVKNTKVKEGRYSQFGSAGNGLAIINVYKNGKCEVVFYGTEKQDPLYASTLFMLPAADATTTEIKPVQLPDSITIMASARYKAGSLKRKMLGSNYRKEWATPVKIKVFDIGKEQGGLVITQRGGGLQSKSLRLEDKNGKEFVLRSVEKFPEAAVPEDLRETFAKDIVQDQISASHPYASLAVPVLADAAGVPHSNPQIVYVPDDPRWGKYRTDFANQLFVYEEREPVQKGKTYSTVKVLEKLYEDNDNDIDKEKILKARLLDMFIGDWDRHEDQWRWEAKDKGGGKLYNPIPRDRDQVFFINEGVLPRMASRAWIMPKIQGFRSYIRDVNRFNFNARYFDRSFLNELEEKEWKEISEKFVNSMTDEVIEKSIRQLPPEIFSLSGASIIEKLKARRATFSKDAVTYHRFISKEVDVYGSDKNEIFEIEKNRDNGLVKVTVHKLSRKGERENKLFERDFDPAITKEIRLYGLNGKDSFLINTSTGGIKTRIIGGGDADVFVVNGGARPLIYDLRKENNVVTGNGVWRNKMTDQPSVNEYNRRAFTYNVTAPLLSFAFNPDDGLFLGAGFKTTRHKFRRSPASIHELSINHALATRAFNIRYDAQFFKAIGGMDIVFKADVKSPEYVINFFGYGNNSQYDKSQPGRFRFYRARFNVLDIGLLFRKRFGEVASFSIGPALQYYSMDSSDNENRFIVMTNLNGLDAATLFKRKIYAGGQFSFTIDNRNNKQIPSRGIFWNTTLKVLNGQNSFSNTITQLNTDLSMFISFSTPASVVVATRFGAGVNYGSFEFFQSQFLGGTDNLRGHRKFRFAGRSMAFNNTELRIKLGDFQTYLFPGSLGILLFHDVGRVWVKNDNSSVWHNGYGAGIWVSPLKRLVISVSYTQSKEDKLPLMSFGYQF